MTNKKQKQLISLRASVPALIVSFLLKAPLSNYSPLKPVKCMKELIKEGIAPILFPYAPTEYWQSIRQIIREEMVKTEKGISATANILETPGMTYKPLLKITELCTLFQVTKPTIYSWIKIGKLKPIKVRSRVYFLYQDVLKLMSTEPQGVES